ncbi:hypothetical protein EMIT0P260_40383 [Pseudomonas sp. IT-P260]
MNAFQMQALPKAAIFRSYISKKNIGMKYKYY